MMQSIGQKLKAAREEQRLTLEKAADATRIRIAYLQALEADNLAALPSPVQGRGFLRNYAEYLGLDFDQLLAELRNQEKPADEIIGPADTAPSTATLTPEFLSPQDATPLTQSKLTSDPQMDYQPESVSPTVRRGRKKLQLQEEIVEAQPEQVVESQTPTPEPTTPVQTEPITANSDMTDLTQAESTSQSNISENIWQNWLNRVSSIRVEQVKAVTDNSSDAGDVDSENESGSSDPTLESNQIFKEIGAELRQRRELLSLHLDEVERNTHVKAHYLEALEKGAMQDLPSTVQTRGMLSNYATFLDLDVDALLLRYADALQARHREKNPQKAVRQPRQPIVANIPPIRSLMAGDMIFGIGVAILLIGFSIWGINRVLMIQGERGVQPTTPPISQILLATPNPSSITDTPTLVQISAIDGPTATIEIPTQNLDVNVQINLVAVERTFMRVVVDGKEVFNARVVPGTAYPFEAENQIEVLVGSGAAIRVVYNSRDLGLMGGLGQVVNNIYLADAITTPTSLPTPLPTKTPLVTTTGLPSLTPVPSSTAMQAITGTVTP
jgi:cytoskeleton protein RodZ